jgi:sugar phosphate permease
MYRIFFTLLSAQIFVCFGGLTIPPLIPFIQADLRFTYTQVGSIMGFLYFGALVMSLPAGWLTDKLGIKKTIVLAQLFMGFSVVSFSLSGSYLAAVIVAFVMGLGYGMINPPTTKGIMVLVSNENRGFAMGLKQTGVPIGTAIAAGLLPPLALLFSWQFSFVVAGILILGSGLLSQTLYRRSQEKPMSFSMDSDTPHLSGRQIYQNKDIIFIGLGGACCCVAQTALVTYIVLYLKDVKEFDVILAGFYLSLINVGGILGRVSWGVMSDRLFKGSRKMTLQIIVFMILGISLILGSDVRLPEIALFLVLFIFGFSAVGWNGVHQAFIGEFSGEKSAGRAIGFCLAIGFLGSLSGPVLFGKIIDATGTYRIAWFSLSGIMVLAFIFFQMIHENSLGRID